MSFTPRPPHLNMTGPRCTVSDDGTDPTGIVAPSFDPGRDGSDGGPLPRTRGNFSGFLPDSVVNDLRTSAGSGAGIALMPAASPRERDGLLLGIALLSLFLALRRT